MNRYVGTYKYPLYKWQLTDFFLFHMFVLFQTDSWWWTIEKNTEGLTIQRSKYKEAVRDNYRRDKRLPITVLKEGKGHCTVYDLIGCLYTHRTTESNTLQDTSYQR